MGVGRPCPPVRNDIVTLSHLLRKIKDGQTCGYMDRPTDLHMEIQQAYEEARGVEVHCK